MNPFSAVIAKKRVPTGPPVFTWYSTYFDNPDVAARGAALTGAAASKLGLLSFWLKLASTSTDATNQWILTNQSNHFALYKNDFGFMTIEHKNSGGTTVLWQNTNGHTGQVKADGWVHWMMSWDTSVAGRCKIYRNGVDNTNSITFTVDGIIDLTTSNWYFAAGDVFDPDFLISEFYFTAPASYFDLTNSTNRDKFYNAGVPVDLGSNGATPTGTAPLIYMRNRVGGSPPWTTNQGTGGNFSVTAGAITDGGADKP